MKRVPSIANRLAWTQLGVTLLWSLAVSMAVWLTVREEVGELLDDTLREAAHIMAPSFSGPVLPPPVAKTSERSDSYAWQVVAHAPGGGAAQVLAQSTMAPDAPFQQTPTAGFADCADWRVYGAALGQEGRMLYVAQLQKEQVEASLEASFNAALATLAVSLLAHLWLRARTVRELSPLTRLSDRLSEHDLLAPGATLGPAERAELAPVHSAIDALAEQLGRRMANERAFSAHAAHSLRTPLAGIDAQLAVALREAPPELQARLQRVRSAASRLQRVVAALLALFRSGVEVRRSVIDLPALLMRLPVDGLTVSTEPTHAVVGDVDLLSAALLNLLDNAVRHGATSLHITTPAPGLLRLQDNGPGVDEAQRLALQATVAGASLETHTGLGLVLASLVARAHGGHLNLPPAERGFVVELQLMDAPHV